MNEERSLQQPIIGSDSTPPPIGLNPYDILLRQSRKMGRTATRTYNVTREFLKRDAPSLRLPLSPIKSAKNTTNDSGKLNRIVEQSHDILATAQTVVLPNNWFPDRVVVDRTKVTITMTTFFWTSTVISIRIEDVLNVSASIGPLFGSLTISSRVMNSTDHYAINYMWRKDAIRLKHLIQGYMIVANNNIDTSRMSKEELIEKLSELGTDPTD